MSVKFNEFLLAAGFIIFGIISLFWLVPGYAAPLGEAESLLSAVMSLAIIVLGAGALATAYSEYRNGSSKDDIADDEANPRPTGGPKLVYVSVFVLILFAWFAEEIGFVTGAAISTALLLYVFGVRELSKLLAIPLSFSVFLYLVFNVLLNSPLPMGWLSDFL